MQYRHVFAYSYHSSVLFIEGGTQHHGEKRISVLVCFYLASILEPLSHIPLPVS